MGIHQDFNSQSGSSLGSVGVHSLTLSHTFEDMKCDSWASLLARTFVSPCLGCEPKVRVATFDMNMYSIVVSKVFGMIVGNNFLFAIIVERFYNCKQVVERKKVVSRKYVWKKCKLRYSTCKLVVEGGKNAISLCK